MRCVKRVWKVGVALVVAYDADELAIDARLVRALVDRAMPQYAHMPIRRLTSSGSTNALFRLGVSREVVRSLTKTAALQLGLVVRSVHYNLAQRDFVDGATRRVEESWLEWTPTWGLSVRFPELELRYRGRMTHGTDRLVATPNQFFGVASPTAVGFFPPPAVSPTLDGVHVVTHQFSVSLPLR